MKRFALVSLWLLALNLFSQTVIETLGPSSRRTPIAISEIMYKPAARADHRNTEYVELYNSNPWPEDISGFRLDGQVQFTFPPATTISALGFLLVAAAPVDLQAVYAMTNVVGPYTNSLKTSGLVRLYNDQGALLLDIDYSNANPWPMGADGSGHSIVLARPSYGEGDPRAWDRSDVVGGSPGTFETNRPSPLRNVMLNEILAHTDLPDVDSIELYNHSTTAVDLSECILSDDPQANKFIIPTNTIVAPQGFIVFTETDLGFGLNAAGETIYFKNPDASRVLDALRFDAQQNGISFGRYPDGATEWYRLSAKTLGTNNAAPLVSAVGINEIMYHPISGLDDDQYVELFNHGTNAVNLGGWKFVAGISFTIPTNTVLAANGYLVVAQNISRMLTNYPQLNAANTVGNFGGRLSGSGERLALAKPDSIVNVSGTGVRTTNFVDIVVDEVTYGTGGRWGRWSDGGGSSLELTDARADKRLAANWADSDETSKSAWVNIENTGVLDNGANYSGGISFAQLGLLDAGECLVDEVEVRPGTIGANYVANPGFENGLTNWVMLGDHVRSSIEPNAGYPAGGNALHLRTADRMWNGANACQVTLTNTTLGSGQTATMRFKARWLHGWPEVLLRLGGNWLEATGRLPVPANLGTPGLANSRAVMNAGPAIFQVAHTPALPAANQPVVVTARVADPDGIASLIVRYRLDPATNTTDVVMRDDGTGGDAVAGDGVFSGTIPGRPLTNVVAFALWATDTNGAVSRFPELVPDNGPVRECVVVFGDANPASSFGAYHLWLTKTNILRWIALPVLGNEEIDGTLIYGSRIIYNMGGRYGGSPWHQTFDSPMGSHACHFIWTMPKDDLLLGASSFNKVHWPGNDIQYDTATQNINDPTIQREQAANLFLRALGVPWINRRYVAVYVDGKRRGTYMEDSLRPSSSVKDEYFPNDTNGQLFKIQPWYEFPQNLTGDTTAYTMESWCLLAPYTTTGGAWKQARYRWNFEVRETPDSANNFTNVYALINASTAYNRSNYVDVLATVVDMENWMRVCAANHAAGNWDSFGTQNGQNLYGWVSPQHRWTLFMFDFSIVLGNSSWSPGANLLTVTDPTWQRIYAVPKFRRMYWRALKELVNGVMQSSVINPILDAKYAALHADNASVGTVTSTESWIASARSSIGSQLAAVDTANFTLATNAFNAISNTITLAGIAPVQVVTITVNGEVFQPVWNSVTNWILTIPMPFGTNIWTIIAYDRLGNVVGGTNQVTVINNFIPESPAGNLVFSEIMFNPAVAGGEYVELFNGSTNTTFDLSGWEVNGLGYTFPAGSLLSPQSYLLLAKSRTVFAATSGALIPVFDQFNGLLQPDGETLSLIAPAGVVNRVRYEPNAPWPMNAAMRPGTSLQLVDPAQDNSRVANWAVGHTNLPAIALLTPGASNSVSTTLSPFPTLWLNEAQPQNLTGPADNYDEHDPWIELYNPGTNAVSLSGFYLGTNYTNPTQWAFPDDASISPGQFLLVWLDGQPQQGDGTNLHASCRLNSTDGSVALARMVAGVPQIVDYLNYASLPANYSYGDFPDGQPFYRRNMFHATPAEPNSSALAPIAVSINEWMAENTSWLLDPGTGKYDDWFELYNPGDTPAELAGYYLTDTLTNQFQYQIPVGYRVPAHGFLLVWADNKTSANNTSSLDLHVPFKLDKGGEAIGLFTPDGTAIDAVVFGAQTANVSEGRYPDGGALRLLMPTPSPRSANILPPASAPPAIAAFLINSDSSVSLTFQTSPGHIYRVEFTADLVAQFWLPLGADRFAATTTSTATDASTDQAQRFYRIRMVQ